MAITEAQLAEKIKQAMNYHSDNPDINIGDARQHLANEIAEGVAQFVIGRQVSVPGIQPGGSVTQGTIKN